MLREGVALYSKYSCCFDRIHIALEITWYWNICAMINILASHSHLVGRIRSVWKIIQTHALLSVRRTDSLCLYYYVGIKNLKDSIWKSYSFALFGRDTFGKNHLNLPLTKIYLFNICSKIHRILMSGEINIQCAC